MNSAVAPAPWPRAVAPTALARLHGTGRCVDELPSAQWVLKRNCSVSPAQLFAVYLSLCAVSLVIALSFAWHGAVPVLAFAGVELLLVGAALLVYARHAADHERITLADGVLTVEHHCGARTECVALRAPWVRVEPLSSDRSLIEVAGDGRCARVGRYLRPDLRPALARDLRLALRSQCATCVDPFTEEPATKRQR